MNPRKPTLVKVRNLDLETKNSTNIAKKFADYHKKNRENFPNGMVKAKGGSKMLSHSLKRRKRKRRENETSTKIINLHYMSYLSLTYQLKIWKLKQKSNIFFISKCFGMNLSLFLFISNELRRVYFYTHKISFLQTKTTPPFFYVPYNIRLL
jgi:hypothetical protein